MICWNWIECKNKEFAIITKELWVTRLFSSYFFTYKFNRHRMRTSIYRKYWNIQTTDISHSSQQIQQCTPSRKKKCESNDTFYTSFHRKWFQTKQKPLKTLSEKELKKHQKKKNVRKYMKYNALHSRNE